MLADVLDAPIAKLAMSDNVDACKHFIDALALVFVDAVLEDVLDDEAPCFSEGYLMPHATKSFVNVSHDLRRRVAPAQLEELLPDMTSVAVDDRLGDATEKLVHHYRLVLFWNAVKSLLDYMAAKRIHAEVESIPTDCLRDSNHLFWRPVLEAALNEEVAEAIDHKWVRLVDDSVHNLKLLVSRADFELLL